MRRFSLKQLFALFVATPPLPTGNSPNTQSGDLPPALTSECDQKIENITEALSRIPEFPLILWHQYMNNRASPWRAAHPQLQADKQRMVMARLDAIMESLLPYIRDYTGAASHAVAAAAAFIANVDPSYSSKVMDTLFLTGWQRKDAFLIELCFSLAGNNPDLQPHLREKIYYQAENWTEETDNGRNLIVVIKNVAVLQAEVREAIFNDIIGSLTRFKAYASGPIYQKVKSSGRQSRFRWKIISNTIGSCAQPFFGPALRQNSAFPFLKRP